MADRSENTRVLPKNLRAIRAAAKTLCKELKTKREYRIENTPGLVLVLWPSGKARWVTFYHVYEGNKRRLRKYQHGDLDDFQLGQVLDAHAKVRYAVAQGDDPNALKKSARNRQIATFNDLFEEWLTRWGKPRLKSWHVDEELYRKHIQPRLGSHDIAKLTRDHVVGVRNSIFDDATPSRSNAAVTLINRVLYWAVDEGLVTSNPAARLRKLSAPKVRQRALNDAELKAMWTALHQRDPITKQMQIAIKLAVLLGQRRTEIAHTQLDELNLSDDQPFWFIKGERTKNGRDHIVPLNPLSAALFAQACEGRPDDAVYVFGDLATGAPMDPRSLTRACSRLCKRSNLPHFSPHDLRRTMNTGIAGLGYDTTIRSWILNQVSGTRSSINDKHYNNYEYLKERRAALLDWENHIIELVGLSDDEHEHKQGVLL